MACEWIQDVQLLVTNFRNEVTFKSHYCSGNVHLLAVRLLYFGESQSHVRDRYRSNVLVVDQYRDNAWLVAGKLSCNWRVGTPSSVTMSAIGISKT